MCLWKKLYKCRYQQYAIQHYAINSGPKSFRTIDIMRYDLNRTLTGAKDKLQEIEMRKIAYYTYRILDSFEHHIVIAPRELLQCKVKIKYFWQLLKQLDTKPWNTQKILRASLFLIFQCVYIHTVPPLRYPGRADCVFWTRITAVAFFSAPADIGY